MKSWRVCSGIRFFLINSTRNPNYTSRSLILLLRFALATIHSSFRKYVCDMTRGFIELLTFMLVILHNKSSRFFVSMSTKSSFFWSFDILTKMFPEFYFRQRSEKSSQSCDSFVWHELYIIQKTVMKDVTPTIFNITQKHFFKKRSFDCKNCPLLRQALCAFSHKSICR